MSEMPLPWQRFPEEEAAPESELPYIPPPPEPVPPQHLPAPEPAPPPRVPTPVDWGEILDDAWPAIREQAIDYARDSAKAIMAGKTVDILNPTVIAETVTGKELVVADAKSRSGRTFVQGLTIDLIAGLAAVITVLSGMNPFARETWIVVGALAVKTLVQTIAAYVMRLKVTPTIKTEGERMAVMPIPRPMVNEQKESES